MKNIYTDLALEERERFERNVEIKGVEIKNNYDKVFLLLLLFYFGGEVMGQRVDMREWGDEWDWGTWCET